MRQVLAISLQTDPTDHQVQTEITVQDDHIPEQDGVGGGVQDDVQHTSGLTDVDHDEQQTHDTGGNCHEFAEDDHVFVGLVVVEVVGQHNHDAGGSQTDQVGELGDVETPGDVSAHAGDLQTVHDLVEPCHGAYSDENHQEGEPAVVSFGTFES